MCGIVGFVDFTGKVEPAFISESLKILQHRGPDDSGTFLDSFSGGRVGFGNRRLSIIDLSDKGRQPFVSTCGNFALTFNGTIYNYRELRASLSRDGVQFSSDSDTEVLLQAYIKWPESFLQKINGIFAFALFDKVRNKVIIARDKTGVKPVFYYFDEGTLLFGSELKIFLRQNYFPKKINRLALNLYLQYAYFPAPYSILRDVLKVKPGECLTLDLISRSLQIDSFTCRPLQNADDDTGTIVERTRVKLENSVKSRLVSDAPVGVLLSGGYDSSAVAAIASRHSQKQLKTFTIGFKEKDYNEAPFAERIARHLNTEHHTLYFQDSDVEDIIKNLGKTFDEPMGDSGAVPLLLAAKLARPHVKVLLSAEGGDELFGGYNSYFKSITLQKINRWLPLANRKRKDRYLNIFSQKNTLDVYKAIVRYFSEAEAFALTETESLEIGSTNNDLDDLNQLLWFDLENYLPEDLMMKADRSMMAFSIENRDPMLDEELVQYVKSLPGQAKCPAYKPKSLLKQIVHQYLPQEMLDRPKKGFSIPVGKWLSRNLMDFSAKKIDSLRQRAILDERSISDVWKKFCKNPESYRGRQIWVLLALELWLEEWMD